MFCRLCKTEKAVSDFYIRRETGKPRNECKACMCERLAAKLRKQKENPEIHEAWLAQRRVVSPSRPRRSLAKSSVFDAEVIAALGKRRSDALPLIPIFKPADFRIHSCHVLHCITSLLHRSVIWKVRRHVRVKKRPDWIERRKVINASKAEYRKQRRLIRRQNPEQVAVERRRGIEYFLANKAKVYAYRKKRRKTNPQYKIGCNLRTYIYQRVGKKNTTGQSRFKKIIGCSIADFLTHLESYWEAGMSWDNYGMGEGKWSIDHTLPCAYFDLTDPEQLGKCFHFSNMKPMWWVENLRKRDKLPEHLFPLTETSQVLQGQA